jgi:hypothetical protein
MASKHWIGIAPPGCDLCARDHQGHFYDAATANGRGPWAIMCPRCFKRQGGKLGTGLGQEYKLNGEGKHEKVAG